jgi:nucleotide-binding universal stress UspA family protein
VEGLVANSVMVEALHSDVIIAVHILKRADSAHVTWVDSQKSRDQASPFSGVEITTALHRHGIKSTVERLTRSEFGTGESPLPYAGDVGADLIVMGTYGNSRLSQFILGGTTRTILQPMTVPVLMSR